MFRRVCGINKQYVTATAGTALDLAKIGTFSHPFVKAPFTYQINWDDGTDVDTGKAAVVSPGSPGDSVVGTISAGAHLCRGRHILCRNDRLRR